METCRGEAGRVRVVRISARVEGADRSSSEGVSAVLIKVEVDVGERKPGAVSLPA